MVSTDKLSVGQLIYLIAFSQNMNSVNLNSPWKHFNKTSGASTQIKHFKGKYRNFITGRNIVGLCGFFHVDTHFPQSLVPSYTYNYKSNSLRGHRIRRGFQILVFLLVRTYAYREKQICGMSFPVYLCTYINSVSTNNTVRIEKFQFHLLAILFRELFMKF